MRRIALSGISLALIALTTAALRGDVVDATRPANAADVDALLRRIEQLEQRVRELESRPKIARVAPQRTPLTAPNWFQFSAPTTPPPVAIPFQPHNNNGVLRADQVKIYMHYQRAIPDIQTAQESRPTTEPAGFLSGGVTITR
jgi:hypothetical protein